MAKSKAQQCRDQISMLKKLSQQAAAHLVGMTPRGLRDTDAPRNPDGSYNAVDLVAWQAGRIESTEIPDEDFERLLIVRYLLCPSEDEEMVISIIDTLHEMRSKYGESVWVELIKTCLDEWSEWVAPHREEAFRPWTEADFAESREDHRESWNRSVARARLRIAIVCCQCKRVRRGRKWVKSDPPDGYITTGEYCPDCEKELEEELKKSKGK